MRFGIRLAKFAACAAIGAAVMSVAGSVRVEAQQPTCAAALLSDQRIKEIVDRERSTRSDLPPRFSQFRSVVRRQGCHYVYIEYGLPETPEHTNIFKLNQQGVIVDVENGNLKCPDKAFTESELAEIVTKERALRPSLPSPFPRVRVRVDRLRCLYLYFEYAVPEKRGNYWVFTIDPYGEVMDIQRPDPY